MAYHFPPELELLDLYLRETGFDVSLLRHDRDALDLLVKVTGLKIRFPPHGKSCYRSLRELHEKLFPLIHLPKANRVRRIQESAVGTSEFVTPNSAFETETRAGRSVRYRQRESAYVLQER